MEIKFGKYKGKDLSEIPHDYIWWLATNNERNDGKFKVPDDIEKESKKIIEMYTHTNDRLNGKPFNKKEYIIEYLGDLSGTKIFNSLEEALKHLNEEFPISHHEADNYWGMAEGEFRVGPDPEDDRILIWEVLETGHKKVVWHFSGWHWISDEFFGLKQGKLPGDEDCLYNEVMKNY